jgi:hypothetical protein
MQNFKKIISNFFSNLPLFLYYFFFGVNSLPIEARKIKVGDKFSEFQQFYQKNIAPKNLLFEQIRIENLKRFMMRCRLVSLAIIILIILLFIAYKSALFQDKVFESIFNITFFIASLLIIWPIKALQNFNIEIKSNLFSEIFKFFNFSYLPKGSENIESYQDFAIIPSYHDNISKTEDLIIGSYKNVDFSMEELDLKIETGSGKNRRRSRTFRGCVIKLNFHKKFLGRTIVKKDAGKIGNFAQKNSNSFLRNLEKINLEDVEFEKIFEVYSSNQIEARYLLTTAFMERLKNLTKFFQAKKFEASFFENSLLLTFATHLNFFEINSIFKEIDLTSEVEKTLEELSLIQDLIDELKISNA